ncbi:hypothetical protein THAOC_37216, partial [Thalassiosira oceanica]
MDRGRGGRPHRPAPGPDARLRGLRARLPRPPVGPVGRRDGVQLGGVLGGVVLPRREEAGPERRRAKRRAPRRDHGDVPPVRPAGSAEDRRLAVLGRRWLRGARHPAARPRRGGVLRARLRPHEAVKAIAV